MVNFWKGDESEEDSKYKHDNCGFGLDWICGAAGFGGFTDIPGV
jgi:hypothetical protein